MPRDARLDSSWRLRRDPYRFIARCADEVGSDIFLSRLLLRDTICMTGPDAARLFYDPRRFQRGGAAPAGLQKTLFGRGGVQGLDGEAHTHRKQLFVSIVHPDQVARLGEITLQAWRRAADSWRGNGRVELYRGLHGVLTRSVCAWAGVPLPKGTARRRTRQLTTLFDRAGAVGVGHLIARVARIRSDRWAAGLISDVRAGRLAVRPGCVLHRVATHRDPHGLVLSPHVAAVELLNVLRPTVALSVFLVFVAHALHEFPEQAEALRTSRNGDVERFAQEVRRFYPFFPAVPARVRADFTWRGYRFAAGTPALLDLYGIDHDRRIWGDPEVFRPERFRDRDPGPFAFVPQGGGDVRSGHRCPGEFIALELMRRGTQFLLHELEYRVPPQDLRIDFTRLPALPRSRFVLDDVRLAMREPIRLPTRGHG